MENIPTDIQLIIFKYLNKYEDRKSISHISKKFNEKFKKYLPKISKESIDVGKIKFNINSQTISKLSKLEDPRKGENEEKNNDYITLILSKSPIINKEEIITEHDGIFYFCWIVKQKNCYIICTTNIKKYQSAENDYNKKYEKYIGQQK